VPLGSKPISGLRASYSGFPLHPAGRATVSRRQQNSHSVVSLAITGERCEAEGI
jgi:hypothetical protein